MNKFAFPIWPVLGPLAVIGLGVYVAVRNYPWWTVGDTYATQDKYIGLTVGCLIALLLGSVSIGVGVGISAVIREHSDQIWRLRASFMLVSMRTSDGVEGRIGGGIFVMSGYVSSREIYRYYTLNADGSFRPNKWTTDDNTALYEEDRTDGKLIIYDSAFKHEWVNWFASPWEISRGEFHIPKGSLKKAYSLQ